jgi:protein-S-isoprenylcysteine O-methyltransferase Ste14
MAADHPGVIAPPPFIYAGALVAGLLLDWLLPLPRLPGALRWVGLPVLAGGVGLAAWFLAAMRRKRTPVDPYATPTAIVQDGPFQYTRNPAYAGMALIYSGIALLAGARWPWLLLPVVLATIQKGVIEREERYLEERFGDEYRVYRSRVRRWL